MHKILSLLKTWGTPEFEQQLAQALKQLQPSDLPLNQVACSSGLFAEDTLQLSILGKNEKDQHLIIKLSVFYQEMSSMCPCSGQEPEKIEGHCEMEMIIHKKDAAVSFSIL